ncbi:MAG: DnaJ domain-containing protein [Cyanobacteria bacterium J06598_3]
MASQPGDYYRRLRLSRNASRQEIKAAFRRLARQYHPELHPNQPGVVMKYQALREAYEVLIDRVQRQRYDQYQQGFGVPPGNHNKPSALPQTPSDFYIRGVRYALGRRYRAALNDYNQAIALDSQFAEAFLRRAQLRYWLADDPGVLSDCQRAIALNSTEAKTYYYQGMARYRLGYVQSAIAAFTDAVTCDPGEPCYYYRRGLAYQDLGELDDAAKDLRQSAQLFKDQGDITNHQKLQQYLRPFGTAGRSRLIKQLDHRSSQLGTLLLSLLTFNLKAFNFQAFTRRGKGSRHGASRIPHRPTQPGQLSDPSSKNPSSKNPSSKNSSSKNQSSKNPFSVSEHTSDRGNLGSDTGSEQVPQSPSPHPRPGKYIPLRPPLSSLDDPEHNLLDSPPIGRKPNSGHNFPMLPVRPSAHTQGKSKRQSKRHWPLYRAKRQVSWAPGVSSRPNPQDLQSYPRGHILSGATRILTLLSNPAGEMVPLCSQLSQRQITLVGYGLAVMANLLFVFGVMEHSLEATVLMASWLWASGGLMFVAMMLAVAVVRLQLRVRSLWVADIFILGTAMVPLGILAVMSAIAQTIHSYTYTYTGGAALHIGLLLGSGLWAFSHALLTIHSGLSRIHRFPAKLTAWFAPFVLALGLATGATTWLILSAGS